MVEGPIATASSCFWRDRHEDVEIRFLGRSSLPSLEDRQREVLGIRLPQARPRQIHSAAVLVAEEGVCGEGDAVWTGRPGLVCAVVTADCVPVLLASPERVAAVHAGWRGLVAGVLDRALDALQATQGEVLAWIGPAIGACCYEVGEEVARQVTRATGLPDLPVDAAGKCHLDLHLAARSALRRRSLRWVAAVEDCTRCHPELLESYRRDGSAAGRNLSLIWLSSA